ncbi:hypothetical protein YDYSG_49510 [Paenibacillus tyrfis]|nr:hypothetical protein YDYSG_49510 [Paenibacillus tyrfis]GMX66389.1 hypothetical protein Elgi_56610 [Paenibacillus elgii]
MNACNLGFIGSNFVRYWRERRVFLSTNGTSKMRFKHSLGLGDKTVVVFIRQFA